MTEAEWLACDQPYDLARYARGRVEPARFRFLAADWGRHLRDAFGAPDRQWYDAFAAWVDGTGPHPREACEPAVFVPFVHGGRDECAVDYADAIRRDDPLAAAVFAGEGAAMVWRAAPKADFTKTHRGRSREKREDAAARERAWRAGEEAHRADIRRRFCDEFRDVAGNPFRPVVFDPDWRTSSAVQLAARMYDARDFSHMPILADALQDGGCEQPDILGHCRDPRAVHVRGCWAIDLVLSKE